MAKGRFSDISLPPPLRSHDYPKIASSIEAVTGDSISTEAEAGAEKEAAIASFPVDVIDGLEVRFSEKALEVYLAAFLARQGSLELKAWLTSIVPEVREIGVQMAKSFRKEI